MLALKRLPWGSLALLLAAYTSFGAFISSLTHSWLVWGFAIAWGLLLAILFMDPLTGIRKFITRWFHSDTVAFSALVAGAAFASIMLTWFKIFLPILLILSAEALARLDVQAADFSDLQACGVLTLVAWLGLAAGWGLEHVF